MLEVAIGCLLAGAISAVVRLWLGIRGERSTRLRFYRNRFFERAEHIVTAQTVDDAKLARLRMMALDVDKPQQFRELKRQVSEFQKDLEREGDRGGTVMDDRDWGALVFDYFMAISYLRGFEGIFLRANLSRIFDPGSGYYNADIIDRRIHAPRMQAA